VKRPVALVIILNKEIDITIHAIAPRLSDPLLLGGQSPLRLDYCPHIITRQ
jgi:hypothetical protein